MDKSATTASRCGVVESKEFYSPALGVRKRYKIYLPPGYHAGEQRYPVLYLFRGHEDEWFNPYQDHSRGGVAVQDLADELIRAGQVGEMIIVGVSMTSDDGQVYGLGINFLNPALVRQHPGIGAGRFEDYFIRDLLPHIDAEYRTLAKPAYRALDGFSLGGYTSVMLAVKHPGLFASAGSYDGSHMFYNLNDPRRRLGKHDDQLWVRSDAMFAPAFRPPRRRRYHIAYLMAYNPLNILESLPAAQRRIVAKTRFFITSAAYDGLHGNRDRAVHLITLFHMYGLQNRAESLILSSDAHHTWKFADLHLRESLRQHSHNFGFKADLSKGAGQEQFLPDAEFISVRRSRSGGAPARIDIRLYQKSPLRIEILNRQGDPLITLVDQTRPAGKHHFDWKGDNHSGRRMPSGTYFAQLSTPAGSIREKFIFLR